MWTRIQRRFTGPMPNDGTAATRSSEPHRATAARLRAHADRVELRDAVNGVRLVKAQRAVGIVGSGRVPQATGIGTPRSRPWNQPVLLPQARCLTIPAMVRSVRGKQGWREASFHRRSVSTGTTAAPRYQSRRCTSASALVRLAGCRSVYCPPGPFHVPHACARDDRPRTPAQGVALKLLSEHFLGPRDSRSRGRSSWMWRCRDRCTESNVGVLLGQRSRQPRRVRMHGPRRRASGGV